MHGTPAIRVVAAEGNTHNIIIVHKIIFDSDIARVFTFMLAGNFDSDVAFMDYISFNSNVCSAINVNTIAASIAFVDGVRWGIDIIYSITDTDSISRSIKGSNAAYAFMSDKINADVVIIMDYIVGDHEILNISV